MGLRGRRLGQRRHREPRLCHGGHLHGEAHRHGRSRGAARGPSSARVAGASVIFVAKYSAAGVPVWSRAFGGGFNDVGNGVAVDAGGNVVIIGTAAGTVNFGGGPITANGYTIVVAKFSPAGGHLWSRGFGDSFSNSGNAVAVDPSGNIAVTGASWASA